MHNFETSCRRNPRMSLPSLSPPLPSFVWNERIRLWRVQNGRVSQFPRRWCIGRADRGVNNDRGKRERERESTRYARKIYPPVPGPIFWPTNAALRYQNLINNLRWKITGYFPPPRPTIHREIVSRARCLNKDLRSRRDSCVSTRRSYRDVDFFLPFFLFSLNIGSPSPWPLGMIFVFHRRFNGCERRVDVGGAARRRIHRSAFLDLRQPIINRQPYLPRYWPHLLSLVPWHLAKTIRISR